MRKDCRHESADPERCSELGKSVKQVNIFSVYKKLAKLVSKRFLRDNG